MKITVLVDNNTFIDQYYLAEPAASYYIEHNDLKILFDCGYSNILINNAAKLGVDLANITHIVVSHGHDDHTGGLKYLTKHFNYRHTPLIAHPGCFNGKYSDGKYIGSPFTSEEIADLFDYKPTIEPMFLAEDCLFLGEIPQIHPWEARQAIGNTIINGTITTDYNLDDSALVFRSDNGLIIVTGCSHSGIGNIIAYAKKLFQDNRIYAVLGGFHLLEDNQKLDDTIDYLLTLQIPHCYPCHCVSLYAKAKMLKNFPILEAGVGLSIEL